MTSKDQTKVMNKGFTIIRADLFRLAIKFKDKNNLHWKIYEGDFESKAAVERRMKELLKQSDFIEDKKNKNMATIKKLQTIFSQKGLTTEERHEVIYNFTGGRTQSSRELTPTELETLCNALQGKYSSEMDTKRKRLLAAIFGMLKKMNKETNLDTIP